MGDLNRRTLAELCCPQPDISCFRNPFGIPSGSSMSLRDHIEQAGRNSWPPQSRSYQPYPNPTPVSVHTQSEEAPRRMSIAEHIARSRGQSFNPDQYQPSPPLSGEEFDMRFVAYKMSVENSQPTNPYQYSSYHNIDPTPTQVPQPFYSYQSNPTFPPTLDSSSNQSFGSFNYPQEFQSYTETPYQPKTSLEQTLEKFMELSNQIMKDLGSKTELYTLPNQTSPFQTEIHNSSFIDSSSTMSDKLCDFVVFDLPNCEGSISSETIPNPCDLYTSTLEPKLIENHTFDEVFENFNLHLNEVIDVGDILIDEPEILDDFVPPIHQILSLPCGHHLEPLILPEPQICLEVDDNGIPEDQTEIQPPSSTSGSATLDTPICLPISPSTFSGSSSVPIVSVSFDESQSVNSSSIIPEIQLDLDIFENEVDEFFESSTSMIFDESSRINSGTKLFDSKMFNHTIDKSFEELFADELEFLNNTDFVIDQSPPIEVEPSPFLLPNHSHSSSFFLFSNFKPFPDHLLSLPHFFLTRYNTFFHQPIRYTDKIFEWLVLTFGLCKVLL